MRKTTEKIAVMAVSFGLFLGGVAALSMERGGGRTLMLTGIVSALVVIAIVQTLRRMKHK